ncbi:MAG TPA: hypothetical protein VFJ23_01295 [Candidatus Nitrosotalea sp.]|nr:hypothetical protein [Candidatus Nitrosotalea sp.]
MSRKLCPVLKLQETQVGGLGEQNENFRNLTMMLQFVSKISTAALNQPKPFYSPPDKTIS